MSRDLGSALEEEVQKARFVPIGLVEIGTDDPALPIRAWTGLGDLSWNGAVFKGTGILGKVSQLEETGDLKASGIVFELSGVPAELLSVSLQGMRQGRDARIWIAALDDAGRFVGEPYLLSRALTDVPEIEDNGETVTLRISAENRLIDLERPRVRRFTDQDQRLTDPTDRGFEYIAGMQDEQFIWGRT